ncbi:hypothetical protein HY643_00475 [Candidatus Woesearchaeota archaeon]|nr:hypothetical protein [Candidatus Woesearchaeota archaeon]
MDTSILQEIGLTQGETKVYIALLELGPTKVGAIIEKAAMASSAVHNSIILLIEKGLITYIKKGKTKHYQAIPPKQLLNYLEDKKKKLQQILPQLETKQKIVKETQSAEIFQGTTGLTAMLNILIENTKPNEEYLFFAINVEETNEEIQKFFKKYDAKRKEKKIVVKGLAPPNLKKFFAGRKSLKMRYTKLPIPANISICKEKTAIFSWEEQPVGYLIESKQITAILKTYFEEIWKLT